MLCRTAQPFAAAATGCKLGAATAMGSYIEELASHPTTIFERSTGQLIEIADALLSSSSNSTYHQLNMRKSPFVENLTVVSGAYDALRAMGFVGENSPDGMRFPAGSPLEAVRAVRGQLAEVAYSKKRKAAASFAWQLSRCEAAFPVWRWARGDEVFEERDQQTPTETRGYSFVPSEECVDAKRMRVLYSCATDRYELRSSDLGDKTYLSGWQNGVFRQTDVIRKVEQDWKMVYLARTSNESKSKIAWHIDLHCCGQRTRSVAAAVTSQTFFNGCVQWSLCGSRRGHSYDGCSGVACLPLYGDGEQRHFAALSGCDEIWLLASLSGGSGLAAWQHGQLFRAGVSTPEASSCGLDILIELA